MDKNNVNDFSMVNCRLRSEPLAALTFKLTVYNFSDVTSGEFVVEDWDFDSHEIFCSLRKNASILKFSIEMPFDFNCRLTFCNVANEILHSEQGQSQLDSNENDRIYEIEFEIDIEDDIKNLTNLPNDELIIKCTIRAIDRKTFKYNSNPIPYLKSLYASLRRHSNASLQEKVILRIGEDTETISKAILCAKSSVFEKMFQSGMKEAEENAVVIEDMEYPVLKNMVYFLNSGIVRDSEFESVCSLYYAANKYNILQLRRTCRELFEFHLAVQNVCRVLSLSDRHNDEELKASAIKYFKEHSEMVLVTEHWYNLMRDETELGIHIIGKAL